MSKPIPGTSYQPRRLAHASWIRCHRPRAAPRLCKRPAKRLLRAVPGGGFGAHNGCANYSDWSVYTSQGGPCNPKQSTCLPSPTGEFEGCAIYGGFQDKKYCTTALGTDARAQTACTDILWGVLPPQPADHCPAFPNNMRVKRYRAVKCPKWHTERTGPRAARAPVATRSKRDGAVCAFDGQCASQYCGVRSHKCQPTNLPTGAPCESKEQCHTRYCAIPAHQTEGTCQTLPQDKVCKQSCDCTWAKQPHTCQNPGSCGVDLCYTKCCTLAQRDCTTYNCST